MKSTLFGLVLSSLVVVQPVTAEKLLRATNNDPTVQEHFAPDARRQLLTLQHIGNNGKPSDVFPLGECQGDCDSDDDCATGLKCFLRDDTTPIPGCEGETDDTRNADFCYRDQTPKPTPSPTPRPTPPPTPPPTRSPTSAPTSLPTILTLGAGGVTPTAENPTKRPTASPTPAPTAPPLPSGDFYLKMYWKKGYTWQEKTREEKWCIKCSGDSCNDGDRLKLNECDRDKDEWRFIPVAGTNNKQVYIKHTSKDVCWRFTTDSTGNNGAKKLRLDDCDWDDDRQKWETKGNGDFGGKKFEIYPILENDSCENGQRSGCNARCVHQMHHPKDDEELWVEDCWFARRDTTSLWEIL